MKNKGIELAYLLRHDTEYQFDEHGYRDINDLINNHGYTFEEIQYIVDTNNKKRFEFIFFVQEDPTVQGGDELDLIILFCKENLIFSENNCIFAKNLNILLNYLYIVRNK